MLRTHAVPVRVRAWAIAIPPLYTVTLAVVGGDAIGNVLGNSHYIIPVWIALGLALTSAILFLAARPLIATVIAIAALGAGAAIPIGWLLNPPRGPDSFYRFDDGAIVTLEGWLFREPEPSDNQRTYLYVAADRAGLAADAKSAGGGARPSS